MDTDIFAYGLVHSNQVMDTGQDFLWTSLSESEWLEELLTVFHTIPEPPY